VAENRVGSNVARIHGERAEYGSEVRVVCYGIGLPLRGSSFDSSSGETNFAPMWDDVQQEG
jgi:hypothetical protein